MRLGEYGGGGGVAAHFGEATLEGFDFRRDYRLDDTLQPFRIGTVETLGTAMADSVSASNVISSKLPSSSLSFKSLALRKILMIHVLAVITAKPGQRDAILASFTANVPAVRAEAGCIEYGAAIDASNPLPFQTQYGPDSFVVVEKWESMAALKAHGAAPHMVAYAAKTKELVANRAIYILSPV